MPGKVILIGYSVRGAMEHLSTLLKDKNTILIDTRLTPFCSWSNDWNRKELAIRFKGYYLWAGEELGNKNHHTGKPIELANPKNILKELYEWLFLGYSVILLCGCRGDRCHNRYIAKLLQKQVPELEVQVMGGMMPYA